MDHEETTENGTTNPVFACIEKLVNEGPHMFIAGKGGMHSLASEKLDPDAARKFVVQRLREAAPASE